MMQPVVLFGTGVARVADGLELLLLAGWLRLRFSSLVADPVAELKEMVLVFAGLQCVWVVLCCPPLGYHKKGVKPGFWVRHTLLRRFPENTSPPIHAKPIFLVPELTHCYPCSPPFCRLSSRASAYRSSTSSSSSSARPSLRIRPRPSSARRSSPFSPCIPYSTLTV